MNIKLNGKEIDINENTTLYQVKNQFYQEADVVILNGFQISEDVILKKNDEIAFIKKGVMPSKEELEYLMTARHTPNVHNKVKSAKVAIAGLGGLGSNIAVMLARLGVGELFLVDFDIVEPSNLNRQSYYIRHLGMKKTQALKEQLQEINPYIKIKTKDIKVNESNAYELFKEYEIVCEAFDNPICKAELVNTLLEYGIKIVSGSGMAGYENPNKIQTRKFMKNLYVCGDLESEATIGRGLMAPRVAVCAGHQANMILQLIVDNDISVLSCL